MKTAAALCLASLALAASKGEGPAFSLEPPPGWQDVTASKAAEPGVLVALKGPETSSFVLTRIDPTSLDNRGVVRTLLLDILAGLNRRTGLAFTPASNVTHASFDNGLTAYYIKADYKGRPRLILAVAEFGGLTLLATLISSVPDVLMPSIFGGLRSDGARASASSKSAQSLSLDGQLAFALAPGLHARTLSDRERKLGFVLALRGLGSELMIMKLVEEGTPVKEQPRIVKGTVLSVDGVDPASISPLALIETPAGPDLVYSWARLAEAAGPTQFAAGYMPWCFWGYSVLAKGPRAADLLVEAFEGLSPGPSSQLKLLAETPRVPVPRELRLKKGSPLAWLLSAAALIVVGFLLWRRWKSATTP